MTDFCDSPEYRSNELFSQDDTALQIMLYYDDLEVCNPLGSSKTKHKLGNIVNVADLTQFKVTSALLTLHAITITIHICMSPIHVHTQLPLVQLMHWNILFSYWPM